MLKFVWIWLFSAIKLTFQRCTYSQGPFFEYTIWNDADRPIKHLIWNTIWEKTIPGPLVWSVLKRPTDEEIEIDHYEYSYISPAIPMLADYLIIEPNEKISIKFNLATIFDLTVPGKYELSLLHSTINTFNDRSIRSDLPMPLSSWCSIFYDDEGMNNSTYQAPILKKSAEEIHWKYTMADLKDMLDAEFIFSCNSTFTVYPATNLCQPDAEQWALDFRYYYERIL